MSEPSGPQRLDAAQARRLISALSLRPGERALCLGPGGGALPSVAAILVGPTGRIMEADPATVGADGTLPYLDDEFDAVILDLIAPYPHQSRVLAEVARVTAPTGRIAVASDSAASVQQFVESAGLRGVAVRTDPDGKPVQFLTAFPPRPGTSGEDAATTEFQPVALDTQLSPALDVREPARARHARLLVAGAAALVVAAAAGLVWGLAGADSRQGPPQNQSDLVAGTDELDADQPGREGQPADDDSPAREGLSTDGTGAGSDQSGPGSGSNGAGEPENQPPVIEDMGLSSTGLKLHFDPQVSDPDGDEVSVKYAVNDQPVEDYTEGLVFRYDDVGDRHEVSVTLTAADARGSSSEQSADYELIANYQLRVSEMTFQPTAETLSYCLGGNESQNLKSTVQLSGPVNETVSKNLSFRRVNGPTGVYLSDLQVIVTQEPIAPLEVAAEITFAGHTESYTWVFSSTREVSERFSVRIDDGIYGVLCVADVSMRAEYRRS